MDGAVEAVENVTIFGLTPTVLISRAILLVIAVVIAYVVDRVVRKALRRVLESSNVPSASIFINIVRALIWVLALLAVLKPVFDVDPTGFIAALGVTTVAISFGVQDTVSNVIGGISLMVSRVIQPGDVISIGDVTGVVNDINWRSTEVYTRGGDLEVIPNSVLNKTTLTKLSDANAETVATSMSVALGANLEVVSQEIEQDLTAAFAAQKIELTSITVRFTGMDAYGSKGLVLVRTPAEVSVVAVQDVVVRTLQDKPWLASAVRSKA